MKIDLWYESYVDLAQPQHNAPLRSLINALMKSVGERGEFRIELGGALHYGTYTVTKPGETDDTLKNLQSLLRVLRTEAGS
jgi:hypothetical protein